MKKEKMKKEKKIKVTIQGVSLNRILVYFIIYSVLGFVLETLFALLVYGKLESRQGFLYGPVCPIYGLGAVVLIIGLQKFKKNGYTLFAGGFLIGSIVEFVISLLGELLFNVRWWDYSDRFLNINGRICLLYSIYWGIISIFLMKSINPNVDRFITWLKTKLNIKILKILTYSATIILFVDFMLTIFVIDVFLAKTVVENDIPVQNRIRYEKTYEEIYKNQYVSTIMRDIWDERKVVRTYPNLKLTLEDNNNVLVNEFYKEIQPYYYKF